MYNQGDEVRWYKPGAKDYGCVIKEIAEIRPIAPVCAHMLDHPPAVYIFTDKTWAFSWNVWPK